MLPVVIFVGMLVAIFLLDAVAPLYYLLFHDALLTRLASWVVLPSQLLFHGWSLVIPGFHVPGASTQDVISGWETTGLLFAAILLMFLVYLLALRYLPRRVSPRFIFLSTLLPGLFLVFVPVVTSADVFSYISYARLDVIYHQNPLTALPIFYPRDPVYPYVYWIRQPSAYGPVWAVITIVLQTLVGGPSAAGIAPVVLALRVFGLVMHLGSTLLIWFISGALMGENAPFRREKRVFLTLAFAWNPLLLFEACVNAHNDAAVLFLILLTLWVLVRGSQRSSTLSSTSSPPVLPAQTVLQAAILFALATCLKINIVVLLPGLLLFLWMQPHRWRALSGASVAYLGTIVLLYLPFWQNGAAFNVFRVNPGVYRTDNSLAEFATRLYNGLVVMPGNRAAPIIDSSAELFIHTVSIDLFVVLFVIFCGWSIYHRRRVGTLPGLIRWLALAWLLYCALGAPWFWPWYLVTFFGLFALVEATTPAERSSLRLSVPALLLAFTTLSVYCFSSWVMANTFISGLIAFHWAYFRGPWLWLPALLALPFMLRRPRNQPEPLLQAHEAREKERTVA